MVYFTCGPETMGGLRHTVEKVQLVKKNRGKTRCEPHEQYEKAK